MKKTIIIFASIIACTGFLYLAGVGFSSTDFIYRKISSDKVKDVDCAFWKHAGDGGIEDILVFDDSNRYKIVNDTLYIEKEPRAVVTKVIRRIGDYTMTLTLIPDGEECYYVAK